MRISPDLIEKIKRNLRTKTKEAEEEISDLAAAAVQDLAISGVIVTNEKDPLTKQAIRLYCKGHYGYDEDTEKFLKAYEKLKEAMSLSGEYHG